MEMDKEKETRELLKRIGYDNDSITHGELWVAREVYELVNKDFENVISSLPSDVDISNYSKQKYPYRESPCGTYYEGKQKGFYEGAEWLKDKIKLL